MYLLHVFIVTCFTLLFSVGNYKQRNFKLSFILFIVLLGFYLGNSMCDDILYGTIENIYYVEARSDEVCGIRINNIFYSSRDKTLCEFAERCYVQDIRVKASVDDRERKAYRIQFSTN